MKTKPIKIILSIFVCILMLPVYHVKALENENLLSKISDLQKHYEINDYAKVKNYKASRIKEISNYNSEEEL